MTHKRENKERRGREGDKQGTRRGQAGDEKGTSRG